MKFAQTALLAVTAWTLWSGGPGRADEQPTQSTKQQQQQQQQQQQIDEWVSQLGHERLTKRIRAEKQLIAAGKESIPALAKAALAGNRDTIEKSIEVLGKLALSKDDETREAARITLQMLSESDQPSTAERAKIALNTKEAEGIKPFEGWDKPGNQFAGGGQINRSVSVSNINGLRTITVKEGLLETTIQELRGGKIRATVTGGEEPVEILAKNAQELKQKLPEVAAIYEQYTSGNPGPGLQLPGFGFGNIANGQQATASSVTIQQSGIGSNQASKELLRRQLTELKERFGENPALQQLLEQQIQALSRE